MQKHKTPREGSLIEIAGIVISFTLIMVLISKNLNMGLSLLLGAVTAGILTGFALPELLTTMVRGIVSPISIELMLIMGLISGLGVIMKDSGDLDQMIDSLIGIIKNTRILMMFLPALIGTLNVPGGAILSAPMIDESGDRLDLSQIQKATINLFYRHIAFFIYPLYSSTIMTSQLLNLDKGTIVLYNAPVMVAGIIASFTLFFKGYKREEIKKLEGSILIRLKSFLSGFFPILIIILLALVFRVYFPLAVLFGVLVALFRHPDFNQLIKEYLRRIKLFFQEGISYNLMLIIVGVMAYKEIIEETGAIEYIAENMVQLGIPLPLIIIILGLITSYLTGVHMAATGITLALFAPLFPPQSLGPYNALLFTAVIMGYTISPLHLCLVLSNEYFGVGLKPVYKKLVIPILIMLLVALIQLLLLG